MVRGPSHTVISFLRSKVLDTYGAAELSVASRGGTQSLSGLPPGHK